MIDGYRQWIGRLRERGAARSGTLSRVIENAVWLLGGKAVGAILSLIYIGMATRMLGKEQFGLFVLILGNAQAVSAIVTFSTWQVVVRFGMAHLQSGDHGALGRVLAFCIALDAGAAIVGCLLATVGVLAAARWFGWSDALARDALLFSFAVLLSFKSTAVGILRLHDRFGIAAAADAVTPVVRLIGALAVMAIGPSIEGFLIAWAVAEVVTALAHWAAALGEARGALDPAHWRGIPRAGRDNPGLWRFAAVTNMGATLKAFSGQFSVLLIGFVAGPAAAGGYRLAFQLGRSLAKISDMLSRSMFAEVARVHVVRTAAELRHLFRQSTRFSLIGGAVIVTLLLTIGKPALGLVAGRQYLDAFPLLLMLGTAAALEFGSTSFEPSLMAVGRATLALRIRLLATALQVGLLAIMLPIYGVTGAAAATLGASLLSLLLFGTIAWRAIYRQGEPVSTPAP